MNNSRAEIMAALQKASSLSEQIALVSELEALDAREASNVADSRSLDFTSSIVDQTLSPVLVHEFHTASTDWLSMDDDNDDAGYHKTVMAKAAVWYGKVSPEVKADGAEFVEQARGIARRTASAYGNFAADAEATFLSYVAFLNREAASGLDQIDQSIDPNNMPKPTEYPAATFPTFQDPVHPINEQAVAQEGQWNNPLLMEIDQLGQGEGVGEWPAIPGGGTANSVNVTSVAISHSYNLDEFRQREAASTLDQITQTTAPDGVTFKPTPLPADVAYPWILGGPVVDPEADDQDFTQAAPAAIDKAVAARLTAAKIQWEDMGGFDPAGGEDKLLHSAETEDRDGNVAYGYIHQSAHDPDVIYTTMENDNATDHHDHESVAAAKAHINEHLRGYLPGRQHEDGFTASRKTAAPLAAIAPAVMRAVAPTVVRSVAPSLIDGLMSGGGGNEVDEDEDEDGYTASRRTAAPADSSCRSCDATGKTKDGKNSCGNCGGMGIVPAEVNAPKNASRRTAGLDDMVGRTDSSGEPNCLHCAYDKDSADYFEGSQPISRRDLEDYKTDWDDEYGISQSPADVPCANCGDDIEEAADKAFKLRAPRKTPNNKTTSSRKTASDGCEGQGNDHYFHESYGEVSKPQLAAYKSHNVPPALHDEIVDYFGEHNHRDITNYVKSQGRNGLDYGDVYRQASRKTADMYGNSDMPHAVPQPNVANSPATTPQPQQGGSYSSGFAAGMADATVGDAPTYADNSSGLEFSQGYVEGYSKGFDVVKSKVQKDQPYSAGGDNGQALRSGTAARKTSSLFTPEEAFEIADFRKAYKFASTWDESKPLVRTGSAEFEAGLYAGISDNPVAQDAWVAKHSKQASKFPEFGERIALHKDFSVKMLDSTDAMVKSAYLVQAATSTDLDTMAPSASPSPVGETPINGPGRPGPLAGGMDPARAGGPAPYNGVEPLGQSVIDADISTAIPATNKITEARKLATFRNAVQGGLSALAAYPQDNDKVMRELQENHDNDDGLDEDDEKKWGHNPFYSDTVEEWLGEK